MSAPISYCTISKSALGDEKEYQFLLKCLTYNLTQPAYSILGCPHTPPCPEPSPDQLKKLNDRLRNDIVSKS